nr:hypothetical protein [Thermoanaerobacterales bacterium]
MNAEAHEVMGAHYLYDPVGDGLVDLVFVDEDGTTELLASGVDLQTALAISAGHAQSLTSREEP